MATPIDSAAASVLTSNEVLLAAPGQMKLMSFYPTPAECSSSIAQSVNNSGQLYVQTNSLLFGGSSNFQISSANLVDTPVINARIKIPADDGGDRYFALTEDGWLYGLIRNLEVSYSNSNLSNLIITSTAMRDWGLAQCRDAETRKALLKNAGAGGVIFIPNNTDYFLSASLPLSFMNWESYSVENGFPFDARTLNGVITLLINWQPNISFILTSLRISNAAPSAIPYATVGGFSSLYISMRTYQLMDSAFSVGNALAANPGMKYTIPAKWLNSYTYRQTTEAKPSPINPALTRDTLGVRFELTSAPAGMLQGIIIHCRPVTVRDSAGTLQAPNSEAGAAAWIPQPTATANNGIFRNGGLRLRRILLQYSGQNIINLRSEEEIDSYMQFIYGDSMKTKVGTVWPTLSATDGSNPSQWIPYLKASGGPPSDFIIDGTIVSQPNVDGACVKIEHQTYVLPLMHEGQKVMRERHFENLPQYSGSALTLELDMINQSNYYSDRTPNVAQSTAAAWMLSDRGGHEASDLCVQKFGPMFYSGTGPPNTIANCTPANYYYGDVEVTVTYIIAALLQNSNGMVEMQI